MSGMTVYLIVSWLCGAAVMLDAYRRPHGQWVAADRDRGWWAVLIVTLAIFGLGPLGGIIYLAAIVPRFSRERTYDTRSFEKRP
jgi:hypothetical protein